MEIGEDLFFLRFNYTEQQEKTEHLTELIKTLNKRIEQYEKNEILPKIFDYSEKGSNRREYIKDADNDGLVDEIDPYPMTKREIEKEYKWRYNGKNHTLAISINKDWYDYYQNKKRATTKERFVTVHDITIKELSSAMNKIIKENHYKSYTEFVLSFVQAIPYKSDLESKGGNYARYPVETLIDYEGDCEDKTYLAGAILRNLNIDVVLLDIPGHIAIGTACVNCEGTYWNHNGKKYYYIESTAKGYKLGTIPEKYKEYEGKEIIIRDI